MDARAWGPNDPNSTHQRWSGWTFDIVAGRKLPSRTDVLDNARRFVARCFQCSVGQVKILVQLDASKQIHYIVAVRIEGPDVHDPAYRARIEIQWRDRFVAPGFGPDATMTMTAARLLAGTAEDGSPAVHLVVAPPVVLAPQGET